MAADGAAPLKVATLSGVKVYNCSAGKTMPQWYDEARRRKQARALRYDDEYRSRIELVQDFTYPNACVKVKMTPDQRFILSTGVYPPQVKVHEVEQLAMKFERHVDAEVVQMHALGDDWGKLVLLRADRTIEVHARFGFLHKVRVPRFGRDMAYHHASCDVYVCGSTEQVYRLNLEQGMFRQPLETQRPAINKVKINPVHQLVALAGDDGVLECWDPRDRTRVSALSIADSLGTDQPRARASLEGSPATALRFGGDGLTMAVGTGAGVVLLYDLRRARPLLLKDHRYGLPIVDVKFHRAADKVVSADTRCIRVWNRQDGEAFTTMEPSAGVNGVCVVGDSGLLMAACEQHRVQVYFVPQLGAAPRWCAFLDSLTEEMEEAQRTTLYDDYKFVTREELEDMAMTHLIGSNLLRPYMHGFFMDVRLYNKLRAAAQPDAYEQYVRQRVEEKIEARRESRISLKGRLPKVNAQYAQRLLEQPHVQSELRAAAATRGSEGAEAVASNPLLDDRFAKMFTSRDFSIDPESEEYKRLHPEHRRGRPQPMQDDSDEDAADTAAALRQVGDDRFEAVEEDSEGEREEEEAAAKAKAKEAKQPQRRLFAARAGTSLANVLDPGKRAAAAQSEELSALPLGERLRALEEAKRRAAAAAAAEAAAKDAKRRQPRGDGDLRQRRGMQGLLGRRRG